MSVKVFAGSARLKPLPACALWLASGLASTGASLLPATFAENMPAADAMASVAA